MDEATRQAVRERTGRACEYCHVPDSVHPGPFEVEHVIAKQHRGTSHVSNLAYSCLHYCNGFKGSNIAGLDPETRRLTALFNPRRHKWSKHFRWVGPVLVGRTAIGRVTIFVLNINDPLRLALREELIEDGVFPP